MGIIGVKTVVKGWQLGSIKFSKDIADDETNDLILVECIHPISYESQCKNCRQAN